MNMKRRHQLPLGFRPELERRLMSMSKRNTTNKTLMIMSIAATFMNNKRVEHLVKHD